VVARPKSYLLLNPAGTLIVIVRCCVGVSHKSQLLFVNPTGVLCELAVVWLRDQNRICC